MLASGWPSSGSSAICWSMQRGNLHVMWRPSEASSRASREDEDVSGDLRVSEGQVRLPWFFRMEGRGRHIFP